MVKTMISRTTRSTRSRRRGAAPRRHHLRRRGAATALLAVVATLWWSSTASAQLDPLLFIKRVPPTIIVVMDTSARMLTDGNASFYDPNYYVTADDAAVMPSFPGITSKTYRRVYRNFQNAAAPGKYTADSITATAAVFDPGNALTSNNAGDLAFLDPTRYNIAKQGLSAAVAENSSSNFRWGLVKLRQSTPAWRTGAGCDKPVFISDAVQVLRKDTTPCNASATLGNYAIYAPSVVTPNHAQATAPAGTVVVTPAANTSASIVALLARGPNDAAALIPAGIGGVGYEDRPINFALIDVKAAVVAAMAADTAANRTCRNTVVVLITGGKDSGDAAYQASNNAATTATSFLSVTGGGVTKRVPIIVVGVKPNAADVASLQTIATNSGGVYRSAATAADVTAAVDYAVQMG
ncbi:MAG: hypothetical protein ABI603_07170, partial [Acidobacteriota bacterium]